MVAKRCLIACVVILALILAAITALFLWYIFDKGAAAAETKGGTIKGSVVKGPEGNYVEEYLGIPYALPPVGDLRWAKPKPHAGFDGGSYKAYDLQNACWGLMDLDEEFEGETMWFPPNPMSEDCLYLNVWVPRPKRKARAVMVWIHGGALQSGANSLDVYNGRGLAEHGDVIVVSINYRVGVFGFLSTGDNIIEGNFGLWDQVKALQWVKENIEGFGGDANLVTIFGESAGSFSVGFHALAPASVGLFKRIIHQSGSTNSILTMTSTQEAGRRSAKYFDDVGCVDDEDLLKCLRALPAGELWEESLKAFEDKFLFLPWLPVVDGDYMSRTPYHMLLDEAYPRYDALVGFNQDEGSYFLSSMVGTSTGMTQREFDEAVEKCLWPISAGVRNEIKTKYEESLPARPSDAERLDLLVEIVGDWMFACPSVNLTRDYTDHGSKVFVYYLTYRASNDVWPDWIGTMHGADIQWIFGEPLKPVSSEKKAYSEEEKTFSKHIMTYWSNFAKYGDPNGDDLPYWPQYSLEKPAYMELGNGTECRAHNEALPQSEYCAMWAEENERHFKTMT